MIINQDFEEQLRKQLGFLERSCKLYDEGYKDEAIRIAVVIRVLIHQTNNSTSLLTHLNSNNIWLLSTASPDLTGMLFDTGLGHVTITIGDQPDVSHTPKLEDSRDNNPILVQDWWNQRFTFTSEMTRKMLVLDAANKDGGAHVGDSLPQRYAKLRRGTVFIEHKNVNNEVVSQENIPDVHAVALRQMGFELLNSVELIAIAFPPKPTYRPRKAYRRTVTKLYLDGNR